MATEAVRLWLHNWMQTRERNIAVNSLSRSFFMAWCQTRFQFVSVLKEAIVVDPKIKSIMALWWENRPPHPNYSVHDQLLNWKDQLVVPSDHILIKKILNECHSSLIGGHDRFTRTLFWINAQFYWRKHEDIKHYIQTCLVCRQARTNTTLPSGLLQPPPNSQANMGRFSHGFHHRTSTIQWLQSDHGCYW